MAANSKGSRPEDVGQRIVANESVISPGMNQTRVSRKLKQRRDLYVEIEVGNTSGEESKRWGDQQMFASEAIRYRAAVARCNFLTIDRSDLLHASSDCSRQMSKATHGPWAAIKGQGDT